MQVLFKAGEVFARAEIPDTLIQMVSREVDSIVET